MEYLWTILAVSAIAAAALNIAVNIIVILKLRMTFNCEILVTEYIMSGVILLALLRQILSDTEILLMYIILVAVWAVIIIVFRIRKLSFVRVYGIKRVMHGKLKENLEKAAELHGLDRTCVYIYGGDVKTPCNTVIFRGVDKQVQKSVLSKINKFLKTYATDTVMPRITALLLDIAVIFIVFTVIL